MLFIYLKNIDKINWNNISLNKNAIDIIKNNLDKINWDNLLINIINYHLIKVKILMLKY